MFYKIILFIKQLVVCGGSILFVNTLFYLRSLLKTLLDSYNLYHIVYFKWTYGIFSNYNQTRWFHLRYGIYNRVPHKKPDLAFLLEIESSSLDIFKELIVQNIPIVSFLNFKNSKTSSLYKKIAYPLVSNYIYKRSISIFFINMFSYFIDVFRNTSLFIKPKKHYKKQLTLKYKKYLKKNSEQEDFYVKQLRRVNRTINPLKNQLFKMSKVWSNYESKKRFNDWFKISEIEPWFPVIKKWLWFKQKRYKKYRFYIKNFIKCGKFGSEFKKRKLRIYLLKKIFCNIFDYQYNYWTWWRVVKNDSFFSKYKKFNNKFNSFSEFIKFLERNLFICVKRLFIQKSLNARSNILWSKFLVDNKIIKNPNYLLKNNSIIQRKLFNDDIKYCFIILKKNYWSIKELDFFWDQKFFKKIASSFDRSRDSIMFNAKYSKVNPINYWAHKNSNNLYKKAFYKRFRLLKLHIVHYHLTWYSVLKNYLHNKILV